MPSDAPKLAMPQKMFSDPRFKMKPIQQMTSACGGSFMTAFVTTPLDVIKTRMQTPSNQSGLQKRVHYTSGLMDHIVADGAAKRKRGRPQFRNMLDALIKISRQEGIFALWSGLGPALVSTLPSTVVYFVAYDKLKLYYYELHQKHLAKDASKDMHLRVVVPMLAGITARMCAVTFVSPIEMVRTKMQSERLSYGQVWLFLRKTIAVQGIRGLWRGLLPTILRDVPFSGIYWPIYEHLKAYFKGDQMLPSPGDTFLAGMISGSVAALATCPFDVVKTHEQIEFGTTSKNSFVKETMKKSTFARLKSIHKTFGIRGLFAGAVPRVIKVAPACAIMICSFEYSKSYFFHYNMRKHNMELLEVNPDTKLINNDDIN